MARTYRDSYGLFISNGILFNHESPRRGSNFVTTKVIKGALRIKMGVTNFLDLGNLDSYRDWGHSQDYVRAMNMILRHSTPDDFVVATGETHSIRDLCDLVFTSLGLSWEEHVRFDSRLLRPKEVPRLRGDSTKIRESIGWKPTYSFEALINEMINFWTEKIDKD